MKKNKFIFTIILVMILVTFVYVFGFSSNVAFAQRSLLKELRDFQVIIQKQNVQLFTFNIILLLVIIATFLTGSNRRSRYYLSNVISVSTLSVSLAAFAIFNIIPLPGYIKKYKQILTINPEEIRRMQLDNYLTPTTTMYVFGIVISVIFLILAIYLAVSLVLKMRSQKIYLQEREEVLSNAIWKI